MAETELKECPPTDDPVEKVFRKKNRWHSFTGALYGALGGAAFIGLLGTIAKSLVELSIGGEVGAKAASMFGVTPLLVMGGLMAVGTLCVWMSQREFTELKCIGDEHFAHVNAKTLIPICNQSTDIV